MLDRVRSDLHVKVEQQQAFQKQRFDEDAEHRQLNKEEFVLGEDFSSDGRWKPATVSARRGEADFQCIFEDGRSAHRHAHQLIKPEAIEGQASGMADFEKASSPGFEEQAAAEPEELRRSLRIERQSDWWSYD